MSFFKDFTAKISDWLGVEGLIGAFTLTLAIWLYFDFIEGAPLSKTMLLGAGICSLLFAAFIKISCGLFRSRSKGGEDDA